MRFAANKMRIANITRLLPPAITQLNTLQSVPSSLQWAPKSLVVPMVSCVLPTNFTSTSLASATFSVAQSSFGPAQMFSSGSQGLKSKAPVSTTQTVAPTGTQVPSKPKRPSNSTSILTKVFTWPVPTQKDFKAQDQLRLSFSHRGEEQSIAHANIAFKSKVVYLHPKHVDSIRYLDQHVLQIDFKSSSDHQEAFTSWNDHKDLIIQIPSRDGHRTAFLRCRSMIPSPLQESILINYENTTFGNSYKEAMFGFSSESRPSNIDTSGKLGSLQKRSLEKRGFWDWVSSGIEAGWDTIKSVAKDALAEVVTKVKQTIATGKATYEVAQFGVQVMDSFATGHPLNRYGHSTFDLSLPSEPIQFEAFNRKWILSASLLINCS